PRPRRCQQRESARRPLRPTGTARPLPSRALGGRWPAARAPARCRRTCAGRRRRRRCALAPRHSIASPPVRVAFVHDHLVQRGGSERTLATMLRAFPDAPVYTAFYWPEATYAELKERDVRP